jgi:hypothetical protein
MNISITIDTDSEYIRTHAVKITPVEGKYDKFTITGLMSGEYRLKANANVLRPGSVDRHTKISSNLVEINVFSRLEARPKELILSPGCIASVEIIGGPSDKSKTRNQVRLSPGNFDTSLITLTETDNSIYSVKAKKIGVTDVEFEVRYSDGKLIGMVVVKTTVALVTGVEVLGMIDRTIHVGSQFRLIAITKHRNQMFTPAICPYQYEWKSQTENIVHIEQGPKLSIHLNDPTGTIDKDLLNLPDYYIAMNATGIAPGDAYIRLKVRTNYPTPYSSEAHEHLLKVHVVNPLSTDIPTYID